MNAVERRIACGCEYQATDFIGGAEGDRTLDLRIANAIQNVTQALCPYSKSTFTAALPPSAFLPGGAAFVRF
jgi:hypothetical protein